MSEIQVESTFKKQNGNGVRTIESVGPGSFGPIETKMRQVLEKLKDSKYQDTFDWSIYDKIAARFGENQPRGGVVFKTTLRLANYHSSCSRCHYAFEIDTYGRGCIHDCVYCYALEQLTAHGMWNRPIPFPIDIAELRKIFFTVFETQRPSKWRKILEKRIPLRIGSMSDSFMWMDKKYRVTQELLKILSFYNYPYIVFTRSDLIATDEYLNLLRTDLCSVQFSISGENEAISKALEPGAPSVARRLAALKKLNESGFWTTVRINPFFPIWPDGFFSDSERLLKAYGMASRIPRLDFFSLDLLDKIKDVGTKSFLAGIIRLSPHAVKAITQKTGIDYKSFFRVEAGKKSADLHYSDKEIAHYYTWLKSEAYARGLRFGTCYIGQSIRDFYDYQHLWSNKSDCCDAKGNVQKIASSSQEVPWDERLKFVPSKSVVGNARLVDELYVSQNETSKSGTASNFSQTGELNL